MTFDIIKKMKLAAFVFAFAAILPAFAQEEKINTAQMGVTEIKKEMGALIGESKFVDARPYVQELITRFESSDDKKLRAELEDLYFFMGISFLQDYDVNKNNDGLVKSIAAFDKVLADYPTGKNALQAIERKAQCLDVMQKYGLAAETRAMLLKRPFVDKLNNAQQVKTIRKIATSLFIQRQWKDGEKWFLYLLGRAVNNEDKSFAASALIQAAVANKKFDDVKKYIPYMVYEYMPRYTLALNLAFITAGDEMVKLGKFGDADLLYSMVVAKDSIIKKLTAMSEKTNKLFDKQNKSNPDSEMAGILAEKKAQLENELKIINSVDDYTKDIKMRVANNFLKTERDYESFWAYRNLIQLAPEDEHVQVFYYAAFIGAFKINKEEEVGVLGSEYLKKFPDGDYVLDVKLYMAMHYLKMKDKEAFFAIAKPFIEENNEDSRAGEMAFLMGRTWIEDGKTDELIKNFDKYLEDYPDTVITEPCLYWKGLAQLSKTDFASAKATFGKLVEDFPQSPYAEDATYRRGVAAFGAGDFELSRNSLENFIQEYPKSALRGEVEFFLGDIYAGVGSDTATDKAMEHYMNVEKFTKVPAFIDNAYTQAGKLLNNAERFQAAVDLMDTYITKYPKGLCSEAMHSKSIALEKMGLPADALKFYTEAIYKYGNNQFDDGVDKIMLDYDRMYRENFEKLKATIGFLKLAINDKMFLYNMVEKPAIRYRYFQDNPKVDQTIYQRFKHDRSFGVNLYNDKKNLVNLLNQYNNQLENYPKGGAEQTLTDLLQKAKNEKKLTLEYRLMMGLDAIGKPVRNDKMFMEDDMKLASMRTLVWVSRQNEKYGPDEARKAFAEAATRDETEYLVDIMFASAALEERQTNWDKVLKIYSDVERDFPSDPRSLRAAIYQADAMSKLGNREGAKKKYEAVLRVPTWRGDAFAEVQYKLGQIEQTDKHFDKAIMWYERCYLGFSNCYNWTGKALIEASKLLVRENKTEEARKACQEFIDNKRNKKSPEYKDVVEFIKTI